jgi:LmbE family N-acetylglucosaminyl deacetylase
MKLLFVNAHPDDVEFTCASMCKQAIDLGWETIQLLMTCDEYGTARDDFKGKRIQRIRKHEMEEAAKVYGLKPDGTPKLNLTWFGEIDGYIPFNRDVFLRLKKKVVEINPDIVIGPDSFFSLDLHPDHKHTGWLIYYVVKSIEPKKRPMLLLYHSYNTNFYIPIKNLKIQVEGWSKHRSQTTPLLNKLLLPLRKAFYNFRRRKTGRVLAEGFRRVRFDKGENELKKMSHRIIYYIIANFLGGYGRDRYTPTPEQLGLISS